MKPDHDLPYRKGLTLRLSLLALVCVAVFLLLILRLVHEQVSQGAKYEEWIRRQSIRRIRITPLRGRIFDSSGRLMTDNTPVHDALYHINELRRPGRGGFKKTRKYLAEQLIAVAGIIGRESESKEVLEAKIKRHMNWYPALPYPAFKDLSAREFGVLNEALQVLPGLEISTRMRRIYPLDDIGAHLIGYVGRREPDAIENRDQFSYVLPEHAGRSGIEASYDKFLTGQGGMRRVRVDNVGFYHDELEGERPPKHGADLILTIDGRALRIAQRLMSEGNKRGALVLLDCRRGAVLAMVSSPTFDLNRLDRDTVRGLVNDKENMPLFNRALQGSYTPGSIIKPLTAVAMLNADILDPDESVNCPGYYTVGGKPIRCHNRRGHGEMALLDAIEASCNTYFVSAGMSVGLKGLGPTLAHAGIGRDPGLELWSRSGVLASRQALWQRNHRRWTAFDTALLSIGQGFITVSPLQVAVYTAAIANGGRVFKPYMVQAVRDRDGTILEVHRPQVVSRLGIEDEKLELVREGMYLAVHGRRASGFKAKTDVIVLAGKTGTAQVGSGNKRTQNTWFIGFGPYHAPRYAIAVLVEGGRSGGVTCAPIARRFFEEWLGEADVVGER